MGKRWCKSFASFFLFLIMTFGGLTAFIDPYFHYHKPLEGLAYRIHNERYQNDGIVKHFDYDAIITGTSMAQNFKTSQMDKLFGTNAIKVTYSGARYKELRENLERAIAANPKICMIVRGLDYNRFFEDCNATRSEPYPTYLYDSNWFNDVKYLFNKSVLIKETYENVILYTIMGGKTTTFDEYSNWNSRFVFGKENILKTRTRNQKKNMKPYSEFNPANIEKNVLLLVQDNPNVEFYLFWPPYSILYFDYYNQNGLLPNVLKWEKEALKLILPYKNVHFFSFFDDFGLITNLDNYKDAAHYHENINTYILECMKTGKHQLTMDNYESYCQKVWDFYTTYDYDAIYR